MPIQNPSHNMMFAVMLLSVSAALLLYNIAGLLIDRRRTKRVKESIGLILDGYEKVKENKQIITVDGKELDSNFIRDKIADNNAKIESRQTPKPEKETAEQKKIKAAEAKKKKAEKKVKEKPVARTPEEILDDIYMETDRFDTYIEYFFNMPDTQITDPVVAANVFKDTEKKPTEKKKKAQPKARKNKKKTEVVAQKSNVDLFN